MAPFSGQKRPVLTIAKVGAIFMVFIYFQKHLISKYH